MEVRPLTYEDWVKVQPKIRINTHWCLDEKCPNNPWYGAKVGTRIRIKLPEGWGRL